MVYGNDFEDWTKQHSQGNGQKKVTQLIVTMWEGQEGQKRLPSFLGCKLMEWGLLFGWVVGDSMVVQTAS